MSSTTHFVTASCVTPTLRAACITITDEAFETITQPEDHVTILLRVLDPCVAAEQRAHARFSKNNIPSALVKIKIVLPSNGSASILGPLTTNYPAFVRSLRVFKIENNYDESADLGAFTALATQLTKLTFWSCGLTSIRGLEGRGENLRMVNFYACKQLCSLDGLEHHAHLEEVNASYTAITSVDPLRTCPALTTVYLFGCGQLASIEALAGHQCLKHINVSRSAITSTEPLLACPALTMVDLRGCEELTVNVDLPENVSVMGDYW